jgi:hypothetical protein
MAKTLSRQELYDLVWQHPLTTLAKQFDISDTGLRRACVEFNIPLPQGGHWQKVHAGKSVKILELPPSSSNEVITLDDFEKGTMEKEYPWSQRQREIENDPRLPLEVPTKLTDPDILITRTKKFLLEGNSSDWKYKGMVTVRRNELLDITVQPKNIDRAINFMNTLIKLLRTRGHDIQLQNDNTYAVIKGERIKIHLMELRKMVNNTKGQWPERDYIPTGLLSLKSDQICRNEWKDGTRKLEDQLANIIAKMEVAVENLLKVWAENDRRQKEIQRKEQLAADLAAKKRNELEKFKNLLQKSVRWKQVIILRDFISDAERRAISNNDNTQEFNEWLAWARQKADWYDPYLQATDELLEEKWRNDLAKT